MAINLKKRKNESDAALISRFTKRVLRSGVIKEVRSRRYNSRRPSHFNIKQSKLHRITKKDEYAEKRKWGLV